MKVFKTILSITLAALVLVSSTSFMVGLHLCGGKIQNIALFSKADNCSKTLKGCDGPMMAGCCEDETVVHKADDFKSSNNEVQLNVPIPLIVDFPPIVISQIIPAAPFISDRYSNYDPPIRSSDIIVEFRTFLI